MERLGYSSRIGELLTAIIPAAGQGALAIEIRDGDEKISRIVQQLNDNQTCAAIEVEREFLREVGGSCQIPVGVLASVVDGNLSVRAVIASPDGKNIVTDSKTAPLEKIHGLGKNLAHHLLERGGRKILDVLTN